MEHALLNARVRKKTIRMEIEALITAALVLVGKLMPHQRWIARREIRVAVRAEIHQACIVLNFALLRALDEKPPSDQQLRAQYFAQPRRLSAVDHAMGKREEVLMTMPERLALQAWNVQLKQLTVRGDHPLAFRIIELFASLTLPPLTKSVSRETRKFAARILDRPEVTAYRTAYYRKHAGL